MEMTDVVQSALTETKTSPTIRGIKTKTEESFRKETLLQNSAYDLSARFSCFWNRCILLVAFDEMCVIIMTSLQKRQSVWFLTSWNQALDTVMSKTNERSCVHLQEVSKLALRPRAVSSITQQNVRILTFFFFNTEKRGKADLTWNMNTSG